VQDVDEGKNEATFVFGEETRRCRMLPTSTMGPGLMSFETMALIDKIRQEGVHFVYVTGARKSTILERLPLMPIVDAAFSETGGRFMCDNCSVLDKKWTRMMEGVCGPENDLPPRERQGVLWDWYRILESNGYVVDARGYHFGFRLDFK